MDAEKYKDLLKRYLEGDCTPEEKNMLDAWYKSLEKNEKSVERDTDENKRQLLERNWASMKSRISAHPRKRRYHLISKYWAIAASVIFILSAAGVLYYVNHTRSIPGEAAVSRNADRATKLITKNNTGNQTIEIQLSDQSIVTLSPNSSLRYNEPFEGKYREVMLEGEAFFDVAKNPEKPFVVYSNNLITRVLGTSFKVSANKITGDVSVAVRSGKVYVVSKLSKNASEERVILTPNQRIDYISEKDQLVKSFVEEPVVLIPKAEFSQFTFINAPVEKVFDAIEKSYGVKIIYDKEVMRNCMITTSLDDENMFDKLNIICKLLGGTYKIVEVQVVIEGISCQ